METHKPTALDDRLQDHRDLITGIDFFVVPTSRFTLLYVWFVLDHGRRRMLHFNVTWHPTACQVIQQLRDTFPNEPAHRLLILDDVVVFGEDHLRLLLGEFVDCYNADRVHTAIGDAPQGRESELRLSPGANLVAPR